METIIRDDQFAYKRHSIPQLLTYQHHWLIWLEDDDIDFIRIVSFDFSEAFDSVLHDIVCDKLKSIKQIPTSYHKLDIQFSHVSKTKTCYGWN